MEMLLHFVFELIKISILSCIYATLTLLTFKIIGRLKPDSWFDRISKKKIRLWIFSGLLISIILFFFMFTYFGDHGLGDSARVPIGHWRAIQQLNGIQAYIQDEGPVLSIDIDKFVITDNYVYGLTGEANVNYNGKFFIYDLANNNVKTFDKETDYTNFLTFKNLDTKPDYKEFSYYYQRHWGGWRLWTLP